MGIRTRLLPFLSSRDGNAAVEFGLMAPLLAMALIAMVDVGLAIGSRMELDRNVRAGVQAAMSHINDLDAIQDVIQAASGMDTVSLTVSETCSCDGAAASCTSWCTADEPPSVFINISAAQPYAGLILPTFTLESETYVQLR